MELTASVPGHSQDTFSWGKTPTPFVPAELLFSGYHAHLADRLPCLSGNVAGTEPFGEGVCRAVPSPKVD